MLDSIPDVIRIMNTTPMALDCPVSSTCTGSIYSLFITGPYNLLVHIQPSLEPCLYSFMHSLMMQHTLSV